MALVCDKCGGRGKDNNRIKKIQVSVQVSIEGCTPTRQVFWLDLHQKEINEVLHPLNSAVDAMIEFASDIMGDKVELP